MNRLFLISLLFTSACNSPVNNSSSSELATDSTNASKEINEPLPDINGCYISILKKDTATLKINNNDGQISGDLIYKRFEKDNNKGTIKGKIQDSLVVADYNFQSEGMTSVREVVFKISGKNLIEGYGEINMNGDTARFKNISQLKYQDGQPFIPVECK